MQHINLERLPANVRELVLEAVRILIEEGPRGLIARGISAQDAETAMVERLNDYPGRLIEPPITAELWAFVSGGGSWDIELPLHDDQEGRMDLFVFMTVDPNDSSVRVTDLRAA